MKQKKRRRIRWLCVLVVLALAVTAVLVSLPSLQRNVQEQSRNSIRDTVLRTAMECYAVEGVYPPDLAYLEQHYGLSINHSVYVVSYEILSSNMLPNVRVLVRGEG